MSYVEVLFLSPLFIFQLLARVRIYTLISYYSLADQRQRSMGLVKGSSGESFIWYQVRILNIFAYLNNQIE